MKGNNTVEYAMCEMKIRYAVIVRKGKGQVHVEKHTT